MGLLSKDIKTLDDLFVHTLQDIYYAEQQITKALPQMIEQASDPQLRQAFTTHLDETKQQIQMVEQVFRMHGHEPKGVTCPAIDGIISEAQDIAGDVEDKQVLDAALLAGRLFLIQDLVQDAGAVVAAELLGPGDEGAVTGDFVVFDSLSGGEQGGVENLRIGDLAGDFLGLVDDAVDGRAGHALGIMAMHAEDLLDHLDLLFGFTQVRLERLLQLRVAGLFDHLRQRLRDLLLGVVDILQGVDEQIIQRLDVL
jgi:hypothetical protein